MERLKARGLPAAALVSLGAPLTFGLGLGCFTLAAQVVLAREVLATFQGTELLLSLFYATWLASFGLGARLVRTRGRETTLAALLLLLAALPPWMVAAIRSMPALLGLQPGESPPWWAAVGLPVVVIVPLGLTGGTLFPLAARYLRDAGSVGILYAAEATGGLLGGVAMSWWLSRIDAFRALLPLVAVFVGTSSPMLRRLLPGRILWRLGMVAVLAHCVAWGTRGPSLEKVRWGALVGEGELLWSGESPYGHVQVARFEERYAVYFDARLLFSCPPDQLETLEASTILLVAPSLRTVAVLGHPTPPLRLVLPDTTTLLAVQEDELVASLAARLCGTVDLVRDDCRAWLQRGTPLDLLMVYAPEPVTAGANRFYTREFFSSAAALLRPRGVLALPAHLPAAALAGSRLASSATTYQDLRHVFPSVLVSPGPGGWFFASPDPSFSVEAMRDRALARDDDGRSVAYLNLLFPPEETAEVTRALLHAPGVVPNTDRHPRAFARQLRVWLERSGYRGTMRLGVAVALGASCGILALAWVVIRRLDRAGHATRGAGTILTTGFASFAASLLVLLGFQHAIGTLYHRIALLNASYMLGLVLGASLGRRLPLWIGEVALGTLLAIASFSVPIVHSAWCYYGLTVVLAAVAGAQFASAAGGVGRTMGSQWAASVLEWADRAGACTGSLVAGLLMLPSLGFGGSFAALAVLKLVGGAWGLTRRPPRPEGGSGAVAVPSGGS